MAPDPVNPTLKSLLPGAFQPNNLQTQQPQISPLTTLRSLSTPVDMGTPAMPQLPPAPMPTLPQAGLRPLVTNPQQQQMQRQMDEYSKMANVHQGLTHSGAPAHGFWQHLAKIAEGAGNVAGDVFAPGIEANIPGSQLYRAQEAGAGARGLAGLENQQTAEQQAASREGLEGAQAAQAAETTAEMPGKTQAEESLQGAQANRLQNPVAANPDMATYQQLTKMGMAPSDALKEIEKDKAMALRPPNMQAKTLQLPNGQQVAGKTDSQGNLLLENGQPAPSGTKLYQQPNYGELVLPTKTEQVLVNGVPTLMGWDQRTQQYDIPQGQSATGAFGHEEAQAGAVTRAGEKVIGDLEANKEDLGSLGTWIRKYGLNTPIADPKLQQIQAELASFAALNPAMHGSRGTEAMKHFEALLGGLQQNPEATIAGIRAIMQTAAAINPNLNAGGTQSFTVNGKTYSIPANMVDEFKKDHPDAR